MMKLHLENDPVLKEEATDWEFGVDQNPEQVETEMIQLMKVFKGRGLAANQVGLTKRVFTIQLSNHPDKKEPFAMFNPKVVNQSAEEALGEEGCLSFPNLWLSVKRSNSIDAEYLDKAGNQCTITLTGIDARCFLHELDHLNGVVFTDKVSQMKLMLARKKQRKNKW